MHFLHCSCNWAVFRAFSASDEEAGKTVALIERLTPPSLDYGMLVGSVEGPIIFSAWRRSTWNIQESESIA